MFSPKMAFKGKECVCRRDCDCIRRCADGGTCIGRIEVTMSPKDMGEKFHSQTNRFPTIGTSPRELHTF